MKALVPLLVCCLMSISTAWGSDASRCSNEFQPKQITQKERILAHLLAGSWLQNRYYSKDDFNHLAYVRFHSSEATLDHSFVERIYNPQKLQVQRTSADWSGRKHTEIITLSPTQFWSLIRYVEEYHEKYHGPPPLSISLNLIDDRRKETGCAKERRAGAL